MIKGPIANAELGVAPKITANRGFFLIAMLLSMVLIAPLWIVSALPLQDYPSHMARMHILVNLDSEPTLQHIYQTSWEIIPNLAMDLIVPVLASAMSLVVAGKVFVSVIIMMWVLGPVALHYALFGRVGYWVLFSSFFAYNQSLVFGFTNFSFGAGFLFLVLAAWVRWRSDSLSIARFLAFSALATVLFFCHFIAFAIYGLVVVSYELGRAYQDGGLRDIRLLIKRMCIVSAQFAIPLSIFLFFSPTTDVLVPTSGIYWGGIEGRLAAARSIIWFDNGMFDYLAFAFIACIVAYALITDSLGFDKPFLCSLAVLSIAALFMPTGLDVPGLRHIRIPPVLAALFFAGTRWKAQPANRIVPLVIAVGLAIFLSRTVSTVVRWHALDEQIAEFREAVSTVDEGASLFLVTAGATGHEFRRAGGGSLLHMAAYATIDRSAFVPTVFADPGVQPIRLVDAYRESYGRVPFWKAGWESLPALALETAEGPRTLAGWPKRYDYLVVLNLWQLELRSTDCLAPLRSGSFFTIFKILKSEDPESCWS